ncbi:MAG: shikimate kinase [Flavobacteriales bacterium]|nr:shikimate kinase [Flavobacteriales bacterium]
MGSGKSTLGKKLAAKLNRPFFDLDAELEKAASMPVSAIFDQLGEVHFREMEQQLLRKLTAGNQEFVMALGGGTPCFYDNMAFINESGVSIYLKYNAGMLYSRLKSAKASRPLLSGKPDKDLEEYIVEKLAEREPVYGQSKLIVEDVNLSAEKVIVLLEELV